MGRHSVVCDFLRYPNRYFITSLTRQDVALRPDNTNCNHSEYHVHADPEHGLSEDTAWSAEGHSAGKYLLFYIIFGVKVRILFFILIISVARSGCRWSRCMVLYGHKVLRIRCRTLLPADGHIVSDRHVLSAGLVFVFAEHGRNHFEDDLRK